MATLRAAVGRTEILCDDSMVLAGGIGPDFASAQEGCLNATALLLDAEEPILLITCDILCLERKYADEVAYQIEDTCNVPFNNILITCTHTHHAPTPVTIHGYERDEEFLARVQNAILSAAQQARQYLTDNVGQPNALEAELLFALGQEHTVGGNSRWLTDDGQIAWWGHALEAQIRPTGPHDSDLPVLAVRRADASAFDNKGGPLQAAMFCHATHNIGTREAGPVRSPGFLGLAAQDLEVELGATVLFMPGAFGSSHRGVDPAPAEATERVKIAVKDALAHLRPALMGPVKAIKRPFTCTYRTFDEVHQEAAVSRWVNRWYDTETARMISSTFRKMRFVAAQRQGQQFDTWLQVIRLGDVAVVGVPGEMFGSLGLEIRRRSPFRNTIVVGLANDEVGYLPDHEGFALGGYQTWVGYHCPTGPGTGEAMVEVVLEMLAELSDSTSIGGLPVLDVLRQNDAAKLQRFYNYLSVRARWLFRPLGWNATLADCEAACRDAEAGARFDVVMRLGDEIIGWAFVMEMLKDEVTFGIGVADAWHGRGLGKLLMQRVIDEARTQGKKAVLLIHVKQNLSAGALYRKLGFVVTGEHVGADGNEYWEMRLEL